MQRKSFVTPSGTVAYWTDDSAGDAKWLVFLPGLTADHTLFDAQMAYFHMRSLVRIRLTSPWMTTHASCAIFCR